MWILLNDGFYSVVIDRKTKGRQLLVRARRAGDLERLFGSRIEVRKTVGSDYLYRTTVSRGRLTRALGKVVAGLMYDNFKNSVLDKLLHSAYTQVWWTLSRLQAIEPYSYPRPKRQPRQPRACSECGESVGHRSWCQTGYLQRQSWWSTPAGGEE